MFGAKSSHLKGLRQPIPVIYLSLFSLVCKFIYNYLS